MRLVIGIKCPIRVNAAVLTLGVLTRVMLVAVTSKSEGFSGFKIIKLYFSLTILSTWVFLVLEIFHMVSQGPKLLLPVASFCLG